MRRKGINIKDCLKTIYLVTDKEDELKKNVMGCNVSNQNESQLQTKSQLQIFDNFSWKVICEHIINCLRFFILLN